MAKIEIDEKELKKVIGELFNDMFYDPYKDRDCGYRCPNYKRLYGGAISRNLELRRKLEKIEAENKELACKVDSLNGDIKTYEEVVCNLTKACNKVKGDIDQELEEAVRGDLMNLKLIKKHLDMVRPTAKTKDEYLRVMKFIDADISNLDKFVEKRWGHGEED